MLKQFSTGILETVAEDIANKIVTKVYPKVEPIVKEQANKVGKIFLGVALGSLGLGWLLSSLLPRKK